MAQTYRFSHVPVLSEADATRNFEELQVLLSEGLTASNLKAEAVTEAKLAAALVAKLNPTAWTSLTLGPKVEAFPGFQVPASRAEAGKTVGRLRGVVKIKAGEELKAGETLGTITEAHRPPASVILIAESNAAFSFLTITSAGVISSSANVPATGGIGLDGLSFNIT